MHVQKVAHYEKMPEGKGLGIQQGQVDYHYLHHKEGLCVAMLCRTI